MKRKSASLLTKTQRRRVREGFADVDDAKRRRDQQRIRDRVQSGLADFRLLDDYPDDQLAGALEDADEADLVESLAAAHLTLERARTLQGVDRERVVRTARERALAAGRGDHPEERSAVESVADAPDDTRSEGAVLDSRLDDGRVPVAADELASLGDVDLRTRTERGAATARETSERVGPSRWLRWANTSMLVAAVSLWFTTLFWLSDRLFGTRLWEGGFDAINAVLFVTMGLGVAGWVALVTLGVVRDRAVPFVVSLTERPRRHARRIWYRWMPPALRAAAPVDVSRPRE